jgi:protein-tyrosine phosphatase
MREVRFPDGTIVRAAALDEREVNAAWRRYGLYLDARWSPTWPAEVVDWPDLAIPTDDRAATRAIQHAFELAAAGVNVEVGCLAGRGRTGTVLACMAVLAGVPAPSAVAWVRRHHGPGAVEGSAQEAWVLAFAERAVRARRADQ